MDRYSEMEMTKIARAEFKRGKQKTKEQIIKLFEEDSIYTGRVIKFEINSRI
jgi:hypothetical protein